MKIEEESQFRDFLKKKNLKFTPERRVILKGIFSLHSHFDVDSLYDELKRDGENISRASIYRTLPLLVECGFVTQTFRCQSKRSYEHIFGHEHHDHMLCTKCGKIIEFRNDKIEKLQEEICKQHSFKSTEHRLGIRGLCKKCQAK